MLDFDVVFLSYDEPEADKLFAHLTDVSPRLPLRVHGVKGFDAAHRGAAEIAQTEWVIIVDGDNWVLPNLFTTSLDLKDNAVHSFGGLNKVNGLVYGNGGVKIWPRALLASVNAHDADNDFCWTYRYWQVNDVASEVHFAQSPYHAFRGGYREAVKLSLVEGRKQDWATTRMNIYQPNLARILVWASVGSDVRYGKWAIYGARCGLAHLWIDNLDPNLIRNYDWLYERWMQANQPSNELAARLSILLDFDLPTLTPSESRWFKRILACDVNAPRHGFMRPDVHDSPD